MNDKLAKRDDGVSDALASQRNFELTQRMAKGFASSTLVPDAYRNNIPNVLIAMEVADRIGASVFAVMQKLYIVHGKPAFESTFLIGTVNTCGRFTSIRYRFEGEKGKPNWGCRAYAIDKDTNEECVGPLVSMDMVAKEGWDAKKGSKWKTMPELMLHYRAAAFWTRIYAPELSLGMHSQEEITDSAPEQYSQEPMMALPAEVSEMDQVKEKLKKRKTTKESPQKQLGRAATEEFGSTETGLEWIRSKCMDTGVDPDNMSDDDANGLMQLLKEGK
jgi:hypothetical protein